MAGPYYLNSVSNSTKTSPYTADWESGADTMDELITAGLAAGETVYISSDHTESGETVISWAFLGTTQSPVLVISADKTSTEGSETYLVAANVQAEATSGNFTINGGVRFFGVSIKLEDTLDAREDSDPVEFNDSEIEITGTATSVFLGLNDGGSLTLNNTNINLSNATGNAALGFRCVKNTIFKWHGGELKYTGSTMPTALFNVSTGLVNISLRGVKMADLDATTTLFDIADAVDYVADVSGCEIHANVSLTTGSLPVSPQMSILMSNTDEAGDNDLFRFEYQTSYGNIEYSDTIFITTGGASDGTTPISWKMVSNANATEATEEALVSPGIPFWINSTGSQTFTVEGIWDSAVEIENDEIWGEIEILNVAASTQSSFINDKRADVLATPADQGDSTASWTGTSGFTEDKFSLDVTATANRVGPAIFRVHLAKPSTTVYVNPEVT